MLKRALLSLAVLLLAANAPAATFNVNSTADAVDASPGDGLCAAAGGACTLRAAIMEANVLGGGPHTINVPAGAYTLTLVGAGEFGGRTGDLNIGQSMMIKGAGPSATLLDAAGLDRVLLVKFGVTATVSDLTVRGGDLAPSAPTFVLGGGIFNSGTLTLTNVVVTGNRATQGGGIWSGGTLTMEGCTVSGNLATNLGGTNVNGGGLYAQEATVTIRNSTFASNAAGNAGGGAFFDDSTSTLTNVTISGNTDGLNSQNATTSLTNVTIANSFQGRVLAHFSFDGSRKLTLQNVVIGSSFLGCSMSPASALVSLGGNLDLEGACGLPASGNLLGVDPLLGPLAQNGGPTPTHVPQPGSPLVDAGVSAGCPVADQRGVTRPKGAGCDIGAVELDPSATYSATRTLPILLDRVGGASFTSQMTLGNRGTTPASLSLTYTPATSLGATGGGSATETLAAGQQLTLDEAFTYLRAKIPAISTAAGQGGTLGVSFSGLSRADVAYAGARTTAATTSPAGRAGLAYPGPRAEQLFQNPVHLFGLRETPDDRTNLALVHAGTAAPITLRVTLNDGNVPPAAPRTIDTTLAPGQWAQINAPDLLRRFGLTNAWAAVQRIAGGDPFTTYAVFNDNVTNDGSFVEAVPAGRGLNFLFLPVVLETPGFESELVLANPTPGVLNMRLQYAVSRGGLVGPVNQIVLTLQPGEQRILPRAIQFLRDAGISLPPRGSNDPDGFIGTLSISLECTACAGRNGFAGARTAAPAPGSGGQYGLFYPALTFGEGALSEAWVFGLLADSSNRSNLALYNFGDHGIMGLQIDVYDGSNGALVRTEARDVPASNWTQINNILPAGVSRGYARITRTTGTGHFGAYGVVNDGAAPGQLTSDGSYLAMVVVE